MTKSKTKKHRFVHPDPEREAPKRSVQKKKVKQKTNTKRGTSLSYIYRDLKGSVITIFIFLFILSLIYFLNQNFNVLDNIKNLL
jgi:hypothetical protein